MYIGITLLNIGPWPDFSPGNINGEMVLLCSANKFAPGKVCSSPVLASYW